MQTPAGAFWRIDVVTKENLEQAYGYLQEHDPAFPANGTSADEAFRLAERADAPSLVSRCWMWVAACSGHPEAARHVASYLEADASQAEKDAQVRLLALAQEWHAKGALAARPPTAPPAQPRREPVVVDEAQDEEVPDGIVVVGRIGDAASREGIEISKRYAAIAGRPLPTKGRLPAPGEIFEGVIGRWPWAAAAATELENHFAVMRAAEGRVVRLPSFLFVGPKGSGKSTLAQWICRHVEIPVTVLPCGGVADAAGITAVTRSWTTTRAGAVPQAMAAHQAANPALVFDEIDKTTMAGSQNGSVAAGLLSLIGAESIYDSCLMTEVDVRNVSFLSTANDLARVDGPLLDRMRIVPVPAPGVEHVPLLLRSAREDFLRKSGVPAAKVPDLGNGEIAQLQKWFLANGRSARNFYDLYERLVSAAIAGAERASLGTPAGGDRVLH